VSYYRVSSDEQAQKDISIPAQQKAIHRFVESDPDMKLVSEFRDEGESAYHPADKRPGFCEMISYCKKHKPKFILVHKLDRFSRNREESIIFKSLLKKNGVTVKSITEVYDPETPSGFLYEGMIEVINQFYSMNLALETIKGLNENASRGFQNGGVAPYGYRRDKREEGTAIRHILVPGDPVHIRIVQRIYDMAANKGLGHIQICNALNEENVPGPNGARKWSRSSVHHILTNEVYIGRVVWNKMSKGKRNPREKMIIVDNAHEAIIEKALFDKVRKAVEKRNMTNFDNDFHYARYLLGNLIFCADCGSKYVGRKQKITLRGKKTKGEEYYNYYYICGGYIRNGKKTCDAFQIKREFIENEVLEILKKNLCNPEKIEEIRLSCEAKIKTRRSCFGKDSEFIKRRIGQIEKKIENYYNAIGAGLDPLKCKDLIANLEKERTELLAEVQLIVQDDYYDTVMREGFELVKRRAMIIFKEFNEYPFEDQRSLIEFFVDRVEIIDRKVARIHLKVPFEDNCKRITELESEVAVSAVRGGNDDVTAKGLKQVQKGADVAEFFDQNKRIVRNVVYPQRTIQLPGDNPLQNSKKGVSTENLEKLQCDNPLAFPVLMNDTGCTVSGFNHIGDFGVEPGSIVGSRLSANVPQPDAPESDVAALVPAVEEKSVSAANAQPTRRIRSRIKPPIIEVVYVPTKIDSDDKKVVYDIIADWILADIEKEIKKKRSL